MKRILAFCWVHIVLFLTCWLPDFKPVMRLRGAIVKPAFKKCGRNFQIVSDVRITFTTRVELGDDVYIGPGCWIQGIGGVTLDDQVMLGPYTLLASSNHTKVDGSYRFGVGDHAPIVMRRGSWTGGHTVLTAGVTMGAGAAAAAGSVVTKDVPDHTLVGGVPARVLKKTSPQ